MSNKFQISERLKEKKGFREYVIYVDDKIKLALVSVANLSNEFYFKVFDLTKPINDYNGEYPYDYDDCEMCRISMTEPKYIGESDETIKLNEDQIKWLQYILLKEYETTFTHEMYRCWDWIIYERNQYYNENDLKKYGCPLDLPIPDYSKLI